jgi:hypothetical protein
MGTPPGLYSLSLVSSSLKSLSAPWHLVLLLPSLDLRTGSEHCPRSRGSCPRSWHWAVDSKGSAFIHSAGPGVPCEPRDSAAAALNLLPPGREAPKFQRPLPGAGPLCLLKMHDGTWMSAPLEGRPSPLPS